MICGHVKASEYNDDALHAVMMDNCEYVCKYLVIV